MQRAVPGPVGCSAAPPATTPLRPRAPPGVTTRNKPRHHQVSPRWQGVGGTHPSSSELLIWGTKKAAFSGERERNRQLEDGKGRLILVRGKKKAVFWFWGLPISKISDRSTHHGQASPFPGARGTPAEQNRWILRRARPPRMERRSKS